MPLWGCFPLLVCSGTGVHFVFLDYLHYVRGIGFFFFLEREGVCLYKRFRFDYGNVYGGLSLVLLKRDLKIAVYVSLINLNKNHIHLT